MKSAMCLSVIRRWNLSSVVFRTSADGLGFVVPPLGGQTSGPPKGGTTNQGLRTIAILVGDPFEETVLLVGQGLLALALDLRQQLVHPAFVGGLLLLLALQPGDRKSTRLNSSHVRISYAVFCLKKKKQMK